MDATLGLATGILGFVALLASLALIRACVSGLAAVAPPIAILPCSLGGHLALLACTLAGGEHRCIPFPHMSLRLQPYQLPIYSSIFFHIRPTDQIILECILEATRRPNLYTPPTRLSYIILSASAMSSVAYSLSSVACSHAILNMFEIFEVALSTGTELSTLTCSC